MINHSCSLRGYLSAWLWAKHLDVPYGWVDHPRDFKETKQTMVTRIKYIFILFIIVMTAGEAFMTENSSITCREDKKSFSISSTFSRISKYFYSKLNLSPLFNIKKLLKPDKMREELLTPFQCGGKMITVETDDGESIDCTFFDRNSDTLLVIGTGFGNEREKVAPFIHMFPKYDIITFDYRGHGLWQPRAPKLIRFLTPFINWSKAPNVDLSKTTFGESEDKDLLAVISHQLEQKKYNKLYGLALCFSTNIFAKLSAKYKKHKISFDKLILDSSLYSIPKIIERISESPELIVDPQRKAQGIIKLLGKFIKGYVSKIFTKNKKNLGTKTTAEYLSEMPSDTPVLFYHGEKDIMTTYEDDFLNNLEKSNIKKKIGILFEDSRHLINHIKYKEEYACISNLFFELPFEKFVDYLENPDKLLEYKIREIQSELAAL